jgi:hypothetical protein
MWGMTVTAQQGKDRGAAVLDLELHRARLAVAVAAENLATLCRDPSAPLDAVSAAARAVPLAVGQLAGLVHLARSTYR